MTAPRPRTIELLLGAGAALVLVLGTLDVGASFGNEDAWVTSDLAVFRAGGTLAVRGVDPYDRAAQEEVMREVLGVERAGGHLAFLLPPHGALLFAPLAMLPLAAAFLLFALVSALLLARLVVVLADLARADVRVVALVVCALGPVHATFRLGQLAIVCTLALAELARAVRDERDVHAGIALAVLTLKPQFVPVAALFLVGSGRWRALGAFAIGGAIVVAAASLALGPGAWVEWASSLSSLEDAFAVATPPYMVNARGVLARALGDPERRVLATTLAWALFGVATLAALALGRRIRSEPAAPRMLVRLALALALGLAFSPHLFFHDLCAWTVPLALARGTAEGSERSRWDRLALAAPILLLGAAVLEPALGALLPVAPQLVVPLIAAAWLVRSVSRAPSSVVPTA